MGRTSCESRRAKPGWQVCVRQESFEQGGGSQEEERGACRKLGCGGIVFCAASRNGSCRCCHDGRRKGQTLGRSAQDWHGRPQSSSCQRMLAHHTPLTTTTTGRRSGDPGRSAAVHADHCGHPEIGGGSAQQGAAARGACAVGDRRQHVQSWARTTCCLVGAVQRPACLECAALAGHNGQAGCAAAAKRILLSHQGGGSAWLLPLCRVSAVQVNNVRDFNEEDYMVRVFTVLLLVFR